MNKFRRFLCVFLTLCFLSSNSFAYQYELSICAIFQNEARFLKEWIDYNRVIGVEHFWLYNNQSDDDYLVVLQPYIDAGVVELEEWPDYWPDIHFAFGCQAFAYQDALMKAMDKTTWLAIIDVDEFIVPLEGFSLKKTLKKHYDKYSGVCIHWQNFGTSWVEFIGPNELMIEKLTMKAEKFSHHNGWYKTVFKVKDVVTVNNPHYPVYKDGKHAVNTAKSKHFFESDIVIQHLQINHYWTRDEYHFKNVKVARYVKWNWPVQDILKKASELNALPDLQIQKFVPLLR